MPTSVAHILGGYAALEAGSPPQQRRGIYFLLFVVVASNLPDLDFLPGYLIGNEGLFHRGASHSILAAIIVAGGLGLALGSRLGGFRAVAGWTLLAYGSHIVLDMVVPDPSGKGGGVALLWPFLGTEVATPIPGLSILDPIRWFEGHELQAGFLRALLSLDGLRIFLVDAALVMPLVPLAWGVRSLRDRRRKRTVLMGSHLPLRAGPPSRVRVRRERVGFVAEVGTSRP
jgi:inner membrane protein